MLTLKSAQQDGLSLRFFMVYYSPFKQTLQPFKILSNSLLTEDATGKPG
jgi:hypothetical protein